MALARDLKDWEFVVRVTMDIFHIGFVNASTKELCYKTSRDLIVNLTTLHPFLISSIVAEIRENYDAVRAREFLATQSLTDDDDADGHFTGGQCRLSVQIAAVGQMETNAHRFWVRGNASAEQ